MAEDDSTPSPAVYDPAQIEAMIQRLGLQPPAPPQLPSGPGQGGFAGFIGDVGKALAGGGSGLLDASPAESDRAGRNALLNAGINMLMASGPSYVKRDLGQIIGYGLQGAQQGYAGSELATAERLGAQQAGQQQQFTDRLSAIKSAIPILQMEYQQRLLAQQKQAALGGGKPSTSISDAIKPFVAQNLPQGVTPAEDQIVRTVWGEANGQPLDGQRGVASVIKNRAQQSGQSTQDVIFSANQFEPWNTARRAQLEALDPNSPQYQAILKNVVRPVMSGDVKDPTNGATHFYAPALMASRGQGEGPSWAQGQKPSAVIGGHNFYSLGYGGQKTASTAPPAAPGALPGVQMGGEPPPPPGGSGKAAASPSVSLGDAMRTPNPSQPQFTVAPPAPGQRADVGAIMQGVQQAQASPLVRGTGLEAGPSSAVATVATPSSPWSATGGGGASAYSDSPTVTAPATPAPAAPAQAQPPAPAEFKMRSLTPTEQALTSYDLPPDIEKNFRARIAAAATSAETEAISKERVAAIVQQRKDADAARLKIEEGARKTWETQVHPSTDAELAASRMPREPGVQYETNNLGQITTKAIPVDPRATQASKVDVDRYDKNYATPYDQIAPMRSLLNEMDALHAQVIRDPLGGQGSIGAQYAHKLQQLLSGAGLSSSTITDSTGAQEAYAGLSNQLILKLKAASGTSLGQMSDRDLSFVQSAAPSLSTTPRGREILSASLRQILDHQSKVYEAATAALNDPDAHYTLRLLPKYLATVPDAIPTAPGPQADAGAWKAWNEQNRPRRGMAYYGADGQPHLWGVPEPKQ